MNRKMHMHTCKVRKLIESNTLTNINNNSNNSAASSYRLNKSGQLVSNNNNYSGAVHVEDYILLDDSIIKNNIMSTFFVSICNFAII